MSDRSVRRALRALLLPLAVVGALVAVTTPIEAQSGVGEATVIDWRILGGLDYVKGTKTDTLTKLDGKLVRIPGFVVPLDDFTEEGAEFLLVPYYGACVHTPPPPPNQIVFVEMSGRKNIKLNLFDAVWLEGTLTVSTVESPFGAVGFQLDGLKVLPYGTK
jgi:uncharacterized protein